MISKTYYVLMVKIDTHEIMLELKNYTEVSEKVLLFTILKYSQKLMKFSKIMHCCMEQRIIKVLN